MIYEDRQSAGKMLILPLEKYRNDPLAVVIGLPRGGVVVAAEVAKGLKLPLDVTFPRKVGAPFNPEFALGAVTETGEGIFNTEVIEELGVSEHYLQAEIEKEKKVAEKRLSSYRKYLPKIPLKGKTAIIVDDGLATGSTMKAAINSLKKEGVAKVIVAVPVAPRDTYQEMQQLADEVIALQMPYPFYAVGQFYHDFSATEDEDVIAILKDARV